MSPARRFWPLAAGLCALLASGQALAWRLTERSIATLSLGTIVADSSVSTFNVDASSGSVTRIGGTAIRLTPGSVTTPTVTISCASGGAGGNCDHIYTVQILAGSTVSGRPTTITSFNVPNLSGAGVTFSPATPAAGAPLTFSIISSSSSFTVTFKLGITASFNSSGTTGNTDWTYTVLVS